MALDKLSGCELNDRHEKSTGTAVISGLLTELQYLQQNPANPILINLVFFPLVSKSAGTALQIAMDLTQIKMQSETNLESSDLPNIRGSFFSATSLARTLSDSSSALIRGWIDSASSTGVGTTTPGPFLVKRSMSFST